jgi:hypothetical protein
LDDTVVAQLEIRGGQAADGVSPVGHEYVDAHPERTRRKRVPL